MSAIKETGVLWGKRVERSEADQPGEFAHLENMSADELRAFIHQALGQDGEKLTRQFLMGNTGSWPVRFLTAK